MNLAFIVLTYNRADALRIALNALLPQCEPGDEVVIADDGSRADQVEAWRHTLPASTAALRHVWHPDVGFTAARARNLGVRSSHSPYLVFLDGDCVPGAHFATQHRRLAEARHFVNGSRVLMGRRFTDEVLSGRRDLARLSTAQWMRLRAGGDVNKLTHLVAWSRLPGRRERNFRWSGIRSCNFGVWRTDFEAVNGFDEVYRGWGHEDADLVLRLHNHGCVRKNGYLATEVLHLWHAEHSRAQESVNRERVVQRMRSATVRADKGLDELGNQTGVVVTELN